MQSEFVSETELVIYVFIFVECFAFFEGMWLLSSRAIPFINQFVFGPKVLLLFSSELLLRYMRLIIKYDTLGLITFDP